MSDANFAESMKVVLLVLSGDSETAAAIFRARLVPDDLEIITRADLEGSGLRRRLRSIRARLPDILAVFTERLIWQRGQNAFLIFGAASGARKTILFDRHGDWREETRAQILTSAPPRFAAETLRSGKSILDTRRKLSRLEKDVEVQVHSKRPDRSDGPPSVVYLRSSPGPATQAGGAASHIRGVVTALSQLGARVSLVSNDEIAGLDNESVPRTIIWPEPMGATRAVFDIHNNLVFSRAAIDEVRLKQPDFIYQRYARFSWAGVKASLRTKRPLFLEYNGSEVWVGRHWDRVGNLDLLGRFERLNLTAAARIFVVSEVERRNLVRAGVPAEKIILNPNGVDVDIFKPDIGGPQIREKFEIKPDETLVGFVGTFGPWHGVEVLAKAITRIPPEANTRFLLIGSGALRGRVEQILQSAGAEQRAIFTGSVDHDEVPALLDACDILVSPHVPLEDGSDFFGSPTKLFEYMAMGKGIVASRLGQIGEVLSDEETALLVEPANVKHLTNAILRLTKSPELRERLGAAARTSAVARHTWRQNAEIVLDAYRQL
jgi:glycosyltransferase involved in cell wall biosynthesis